VITEQNGLVTEVETRDSSNGPLTTSRIRVRYDALGRPVESTHDRDDDGIFEFRTVYEWTDATRFTEFNFHDGSETPVEWLRVERDGVTGARRILGFVIEAECRSSLTIRLPNSALTVESLVDTTGYDDCLDAWRNGARSKATYEVLTQGLKRVMQRTDDDADGQFESFTEWSYLPEGHTNTIQHTEVDGTAVTRSLDEAFVTRDIEGRLLSYEFRSEFAPWHSGEYRFSYDAAGNVVSEYRENGPPSERRRRTLGFQAWDERNRLTGAAGFTLGDPDDTVYSVVEYTGPFPFSRCDVPVP